MFLKSWWCKKYNRPFKDPLLESYSIFDLMYEYHDDRERIIASEAMFEEEADKIEEEQMEETLDWIEEEERKEREAAEKAQAEAEEKWMQEQLEKEMKAMKDKHGDDFGDDLSLDFDG